MDFHGDTAELQGRSCKLHSLPRQNDIQTSAEFKHDRRRIDRTCSGWNARRDGI